MSGPLETPAYPLETPACPHETPAYPLARRATKYLSRRFLPLFTPCLWACLWPLLTPSFWLLCGSYVAISPYPASRSEIRILHCELEGGKTARFANGKFKVACSTTITDEKSTDAPADADALEYLTCCTDIHIECPVPNLFATVLPAAFVSKAGSAVMRKLVDVLLPTFLADLKGDYEVWREGKDEERLVPE